VNAFVLYARVASVQVLTIIFGEQSGKYASSSPCQGTKNTGLEGPRTKRKFATTAISMRSGSTSIRIHEAKRLLQKTDCLVIDVALTVGFNGISHFNRVFKHRRR
jgi:hypothetical protein